MKKLKFLSVVLACIAFYSCSNNEEPVSKNLQSKTESLIEANVAQKEFAQILSKAVYNNSAMRQFLKNEAVKQFDNDYDIFYPYVKDEKVSGNQTFRDVLLSYSKDKTRFSEIEESLPLLNILVPDLSLFKAFSADKWDVNDNEVGVSYTLGNKDAVLYGNGDSIATLGANEVPDFPILVVKNSERLKVTASTRAANGNRKYSYAFISNAFNGSLSKSQTRSDYDETIPQESTEPYVKASELDPSVIAAYQEFKNNKQSIDRDYIYYGLNNSKPTNGTLNTNARESLYAFKVNPQVYSQISDQENDARLNNRPDNNDHSADNGTTSQKKAELSNEEVLNNIWTNGNFEIFFKVYVGNKDSNNSCTKTMAYSVSGKQLFQVATFHVHKEHKTAFRHSKYTYTINTSDLRSKWVYTNQLEENNNNIVFAQPWDISNYSLTINMEAYEHDEQQTIETTNTYTNEYTVKQDFSTETSTTVDKTTFGVKSTIGYSSTTSKSETVKTTTTKGDDMLGTVSYSYYDPIIVSDSEKDTKGYKIFTPSSGNMTVMILPKNLR